MATALRVLIVEDRPADAELMVHELRRAGFEPDWQRVETEEDYLAALTALPDIILADHTLPQFGAPRALELLKKQDLNIPFIVITGSISEEVAVERIKQGAADYMLKDRMARLGPAVERAFNEKRLRDEKRKADEEIRRNLERIRALHEIDKAITSSLDLRQVLDTLLEKIDLSLPYSAATIRLWNEASRLLEPTACRNLDEKEWRAREWMGGRGSANIVFETKAALTIHNCQTDTRIRHPEFFRKHSLVSYLGIPLVAHDEILGVISFYTKEEHEFTGDEIEFLTTLAEQAAIAIHNARLYQAVESSRRELELTNQYLERSLRQLSGLHTALTPLASSDTIGEMMDGIIDKLKEATGADAARIRFWDKTTGKLIRVAQRGFPDHFFAQEAVRFMGGAAALVSKTGEPIIAPDIAADLRFKVKNQLEFGLQSCALLPLKVHNEVRGLIHLSSRKLGYFDEEQKDHLMAIARQMGIALENRELFDNLRASRDDLEKANKIKDEFLSVMSHELRTPLNVVVGYSSMIMDGMLGEVNERQKEALEKVIRRTDDQLVLVNNILYATVLENEQMTVSSQPVPLKDFLDQLKLTYEEPINKELSIRWDYPSDLPIIATDGAKLKHVLHNLIDNALKFTAKGSVTISARIRREAIADQLRNANFEIRNQRPTPLAFVEFNVADTGAGIPKDALPFIFDKFKQVDSSETRLYGGVGMGLYIVKQFTELLGGAIEVESEPDRGSTFTVKIPVQN